MAAGVESCRNDAAGRCREEGKLTPRKELYAGRRGAGSGRQDSEEA